jgi:Flp pilus assembly pilin Flp
MTSFVKKILTAINTRKKDDKGGAAVEYILIAVIIGVGLILAFSSLKRTLATTVTNSNTTIAAIPTDGKTDTTQR